MKADYKGFAFASRLSEDYQVKSKFASVEEDRTIRPPMLKKPAQAKSPKPSAKFQAVPRTNSNGADLFQFIEPQHQASDIVLDTENFRLLSEVVEEFRRGDDLRRHGLSPRSKLLFCGPPGCGKTLCAEVIAYELHLPLFVARLDGIITTYLGETASNLRQLFEAAMNTPSVLFLDEFDALARTRTDNSEHNEIRRVVNSLLKMIEAYRGRGLLIAATNLQSSIDDAAWRRFDEVLLFKPPTRHQIRKLLRVKTRNFRAEIDFEEFLEALEGMSFAEIERICMSAIKREIINRKSTLSRYSFMAAMKDEKRRIAIRSNVQAPE
ncbi:ATP-binding protein [Rhizobium sp. IBUN]|uniref:AAA family ATPase n=1 Tax=Rhizobium sp. IBUN TaxID=1042326 RepID=UPI0003F7B753|nr:ATP-binding protein [Rhizobium sp. IBUN]